jgi:hypothetical protein
VTKTRKPDGGGPSRSHSTEACIVPVRMEVAHTAEVGALRLSHGVQLLGDKDSLNSVRILSEASS